MIDLRLPRLRAERMELRHFHALRELHVDAAMMRWIGGVRTEAETSEYLERHLIHWRQYGFGFWMLSQRDEPRIVGLAGLRRCDIAGVAEIELGYGLVPAEWGKGLATETARACMAYGERLLGATSLIAIANPANSGSIQVLRKLGFDTEGITDRAGESTELFRYPAAHTGSPL